MALRLGRADALTHELAQLCFGWSKGPGNTGALELEPVWVGREEVDLVVRRVREVPPVLAMLFSEAVNHLRAAIDNTVFHLVTKARTRRMTPAQARGVAMPIHQKPDQYHRWAEKKRKEKVPELADGTLAGRILALQPFRDPTTTVSSISDELAGYMGVVPGRVHPLTLLQDYPNHDKHRQIRLSVTSGTYRRDDVPFWGSDRSMRLVAPGDIVDGIDPAGYTLPTTHTFLTVERPAGGVWVSPGGTRSPQHICLRRRHSHAGHWPGIARCSTAGD